MVKSFFEKHSDDVRRQVKKMKKIRNEIVPFKRKYRRFHGENLKDSEKMLFDVDHNAQQRPYSIKSQPKHRYKLDDSKWRYLNYLRLPVQPLVKGGMNAYLYYQSARQYYSGGQQLPMYSNILKNLKTNPWLSIPLSIAMDQAFKAYNQYTTPSRDSITDKINNKSYMIKGFLPKQLPFNERQITIQNPNGTKKIFNRNELKSYNIIQLTPVVQNRDSANIHPLNEISVGSDYDKRIGRLVNNVSLEFQVYINMNVALTSAAVRVLIIIDRQSNAILLSDASIIFQLIDSSTYPVFAMSNLNYRDRFTWLYEKSIFLNTNNPNILLQGFVKLNLLQSVYQENDEVAYNPTTNTIYIVLCHDSPDVSKPSYIITTRLRYVDV